MLVRFVRERAILGVEDAASDLAKVVAIGTGQVVFPVAFSIGQHTVNGIVLKFVSVHGELLRALRRPR